MSNMSNIKTCMKIVHDHVREVQKDRQREVSSEISDRCREHIDDAIFTKLAIDMRMLLFLQIDHDASGLAKLTVA